MEMKKVLICFVQDRSGSMSSVWEETLSGFKTYIAHMSADQKKDSEVSYLFSLTTFDTQIDTPCLGVPIADVDGDILKKFGPRGSTALYDAVGKTLQALDDDKSLTFDKAIVVIVTDGQENSSREWSKTALHAAIDERIKRGNWTFTYLGTQPETWDDANSLGVGVGASATYNAANAGQTYATMAFASANMARSAQGSSRSFLHDNTSKFMRCAVGMSTQTDNDDDAVPVGVGVSSAPFVPPTPKTRAVPRQTPPTPSKSSTNRRWK
jgi:uncharacterized protein YegL